MPQLVAFIIRAAFGAFMLYFLWRTLRIEGVTRDDLVPEALKPFEREDQISPTRQTPKARMVSLQSVDPQFSELQFLEIASASYLTALRAEAAMNPDALDGIATPRYRDELAHCIVYWRSEGLKRHTSGVAVSSSTIMSTRVDSEQQRVIVRLSGKWVHYTARVSNHALVDGSTQRQSFTKFAIFVRPPDATTPQRAASGSPAHCPGCGAPVKPGIAVCRSCGKLLEEGSAWRLDRVTNTPYV